MKKFLVVMIASCFSFGFICPAYGNGFTDYFLSLLKNEDKQCTEAKKSFTTASIDFLNALEQERCLLANQKSGNFTQISNNCSFLETKVKILKSRVLIMCNTQVTSYPVPVENSL
jgi:hypothetical protein